MAIISISDSQVNGANQILVADTNSKIPAKDGSQITILNASNVASGTIASARLDVGTTANKLVQLDGSGNLPVIDGSLLTGIVSATISASDPTISTNPSGGVGTEWLNSTSGEMYICTDATAGANVWTNVGAGTGDVAPFGGVGSRGVFGGRHNSYLNTMDYVTIATPGNATDFGDFTVSARSRDAVSNKTRGVWGGGHGALNTMDYITIATPGNSTDFGDLTETKNNTASCSDGTKGLCGGGQPSGFSNVIDYVTISTIGNATDFGDLTVAGSEFGACSGA